MTTSDDLEQFALKLRSQRFWSAAIQEDLMYLIREPAMFYRGQIIPPNNRAVAMDNLFRSKPTAWDIGMESVGLQCYARLRLWYQSPSDTGVRLHVEVISGDLPLATNALALTAAIARTWALIIRSGVKGDFEIVSNQ
jgi:hypothetical protein